MKPGSSKKRIWVCGAVLLCAAAAAGILLWNRPQKNRAYHLIYIPKTEDGTNDFWTELISGVNMAAAECGADLEIMAPEEEQDVEQQTRLLAQAVEKKPDAILLSPSSFTGYTDLLNEAKKEGIRIVYIDSYTEEKLQDITVATDNLEVGKRLGEYAAGLVGEEDQIVIISHVQGVSTAVEREQGFREGLGTRAGNVVDVKYCDSMYDKAYHLTMKMMEKYPDLRMVAGMNEYSSVGAARAVLDAGRQEQIVVVGVDSSQEAMQLMEHGVFRGLVVQKAFKMGYVGVQKTIQLLKGGQVEENTDSGCELVTPDNMYDREIEKLIFPFGTQKG